MIITYKFLTDEIIQVEVDDRLGLVIQELDRTQNNRNRTETRRHTSFDDSCNFFAAENCAKELERKEQLVQLYQAIQQLSPEQQNLLNRVFWKEETQASIAVEKGVSTAAISNQLKRIYTKLKKLLR